MPDIPEKYKTLREITEAIAKADDEIIEQYQTSTQRAKRYSRAVLARERYADAKSLVAERTEKATADFLREAAHHDVKHAIHKAEHRLAEARCQAVFKQRPFLQHLDKARDAAATQGHAKRSQHTVEAGPWRASTVCCDRLAWPWVAAASRALSRCCRKGLCLNTAWHLASASRCSAL